MSLPAPHGTLPASDDRLTSSSVIVNPRLSAAAQIAIYNDASRLKLQQVVRNDYPCLAHYLGDADFKNLVNSYAAETPSFSYNLDFYPFGFWRFVRRNYGHTAVGDIAELEGAIAECQMMPGASQLLLLHLPMMDMKKLYKMKLRLRTPSKLLRFGHDVEGAIEAFMRGEERRVMADKPIYLFLFRHNHEVQRKLLEEGEYHLLQALTKTEVLGEAVKTMSAATGQREAEVAAQVANWLRRWILEGFLAVAGASSRP